MDHALEVGLCSRIALELMLGLEDDGFDFYTDNNYISPHHLKKWTTVVLPESIEKGFSKSLIKRKKYKIYEILYLVESHDKIRMDLRSMFPVLHY